MFVLPLIGRLMFVILWLCVDVFTDPFNYIFTRDEAYARAQPKVLSGRADYIPLTDRIERDSFDPYATFRSVYMQNRKRVIRDYLGSIRMLKNILENKVVNC